jgi:hypothetical protein
MVASRPENPDAEPKDVQYPETVPDPVIAEDTEAGFEPGTELLPEKGDFHQNRAGG